MLTAPIHQHDSNARRTRPGSRWRLVWLVLFVAGMLLAWGAQQLARTTLTGQGLSGEELMDSVDATLPRPELTPEQVVSKQVESMRASVLDHDRLRECYSLAAPSNRAVTGPFENFANIVRSSPYDNLGTCQAYQVGRAVIEGNSAAVLVSLLTSNGQSLAFRFLLSKQSEVPYADCWMTEGVYALTAEELTNPNSPISPFREQVDVTPSQTESVELSREGRFD
jgi:hypothetical protein